MPAGNQSNCRH